jgi:hypothetical protein
VVGCDYVTCGGSDVHSGVLTGVRAGDLDVLFRDPVVTAARAEDKDWDGVTSYSDGIACKKRRLHNDMCT